ncbi:MULTISPECIES: YHS domain-containing protein [Niastella]|uniref:YHS domain-containing protein n=1 Tax=Niastella soli TaxID=2821487 RepID=A0ABS3YXQ9_9BACT|nr:YHS domain-containing protein [Niastella soli]MBO9201941.1 YHS domain-containing protein [Niastella soli]
MKCNLFAALLLMVLFSCNNNEHANAVDTTQKDSVTVITRNQGFDGIEYASKMDLACGMMLSAGIQDTTLYKGKIYGFCSKDCKSDFLKTPEAFLSSKYRH